MSAIMVANIPIAWIWMKLDNDPYIIYYVSILTAAAALLARLVLLKRDVGFRARDFLYGVFVKTAMTLTLSCVAVCWIRSIFPQTFWGLVLFAIMSVGTMALISFSIGINSREREIVIGYIKNHTGRRL